MRPVFRVLGPVEVAVGAELLPIGGPKQRAVLALLLVEHGHVVSAERLVDSLWGDDSAEPSKNVLQVYISHLRKVLEPAARALGQPIIETRRPGYVVDVAAEQVDLGLFEHLVDVARRRAREGDAATAVAQLQEALALWRGSPLADVADEPAVAGTIARLESARLAASSDRVELMLTLGRHIEVLDELTDLVDRHPLDERLRGLLMVALYRCGRQADALATFQDARRALVDELGIDPGPELRRLEGLVLQQATELAAPAPGTSDRQLSTVVTSSVLAPRGSLVTGDRRYALDRAVTTIGRRSDRVIILDDDRVSRVHAEVRRSGVSYVVADVGSRNGVRVNGERIEAARPLVPGDEIVIGSTVFTYVET